MIFLVGLEGIPRREGTDAAVWVNGEEKAITYVSVSYVFAQGATEPSP